MYKSKIKESALDFIELKRRGKIKQVFIRSQFQDDNIISILEYPTKVVKAGNLIIFRNLKGEIQLNQRFIKSTRDSDYTITVETKGKLTYFIEFDI